MTSIWGGPGRDILTLLLDMSLPPYGATFPETETEADAEVMFYRALDDREEATGEIVGVEIDDFVGVEIESGLGFDHWDALAALPPDWRLVDAESLAVVDALKQLQRSLRASVSAPVGA